MTSYLLSHTIATDNSRPYYFINGRRVSEEKQRDLARRCVRFDCLYSERLRNGRHRHSMYGYTNE